MYGDEDNTFVQGAWQKTLLPWLTSRVMAKYAYYNTHYVNKDTTRMLIDNTYEQQELSLSTTQLFRLKERWTVSLSYDFKWNSLDADIQRFVYPKRHAHLIALATAIDLGQVKIQSSVVETIINDRQRKKEGTTTTDCLSPALFVNYSPTFWRDLSLRAFAKKSFRMPTFNDLYYTEVGNAELKPEKATQYNIGLVVEHHFRQKCITLIWLDLFSCSLEFHILTCLIQDFQIFQFKWLYEVLSLLELLIIESLLNFIDFQTFRWMNSKLR